MAACLVPSSLVIVEVREALGRPSADSDFGVGTSRWCPVGRVDPDGNSPRHFLRSWASCGCGGRGAAAFQDMNTC